MSSLLLGQAHQLLQHFLSGIAREVFDICGRQVLRLDGF